MVKWIDTLWNWGHLEGSHNQYTGMECTMSPERFAREYGIVNAFIVSYNGNIQPPFDALAKRLSGIKQIKWSVLGDISTPMPEEELGNTQDVLDTAATAQNITGGVVDDIFFPERLERFGPEVLKKIRKTLNDRGLDFWCVLYTNQLGEELSEYLDCFDGVTLWVWECENIPKLRKDFEKLKEMAPDKRIMLGVYLWDYSAKKEMDPVLFEQHLAECFRLTREKQIEGTVICSSTLGDAKLETNRILKAYIARQGNTVIS